ncbi:acetyltransferase (GNAT) family protein [Fontibacillus phaseoli]|uniref:Acetyltransferase (GNAT) family protein n=1 Tax=Fontibacillus phaseoli TaxID=1416533 RepID=A0A369BCC1_9BACL|nr:GNAT family N-acetyltransferase [Fontibacillus phaseoli]RCX17314.1 acetyltransferase (GNAT) family protein [Fontibacillus phaseoli]
MKIAAWQPCDSAAWAMQHAEILNFVKRYGRKKIPAGTYRALMKLSCRELLMPGSSLLLATLQAEDGPRIAGISCVSDYGRGISLVVVHPLYRGQGLGSELLNRQFSSLGKLTCLVSLSNLSSLQMCFRAGFRASRLLKPHGGRAVLVLEKNQSGAQEAASPPDHNFAIHSLQRR